MTTIAILKFMKPNYKLVKELLEFFVMMPGIPCQKKLARHGRKNKVEHCQTCLQRI